MAITNAQQFKQLVNPPMKGKKRPGYRGEAAAASDKAAGRSAGRDTSDRGTADRGDGPKGGPTVDMSQFGDTGDIVQADFTPYSKRPDTITRFGDNIRANIKSNPLSIFSPTMTILKNLYQTKKAQNLLGFNPTTTIDDDDDDTPTGGGDRQDNTGIMMAQAFTPYQEDVIEDKIEELSPIELALQQRDLLGGPRAFAAEGGIMDLEQARQGYKLGKLVKKVTRGLKKIVKSPVGKTALAAAGIFKLGGGSFTDLIKGRGSGFDFSKIPGSGFLPSDSKDKFALAAAAGLTAAPFLLSEDDTEDEYQKFLASRGASGQGFDIQGIRDRPYDVLGRAFVAEGGKPEPVAKKTMPLLDMGGKEMDLRAEGGFVPIGRMEKADDVPARLSKNEFVFTADAVRNAGDGDVDKGAEVMYNMMKNLESGGDVSEESQGLEGARKMFQTSQRLEEVL